MAQIDQIYRRALATFQQAGGRSLSAAFVAQRLNVTPTHAEDILDDMVRESVLEYDFDHASGVHYKPGAAYPYESFAARAPAYDAAVGGPAYAGAPAYDAAVGLPARANTRAAATPGGDFAGYDGAVGTAAPPRAYTGATHNRRTSRPSAGHSSRAPRRTHEDSAATHAQAPQQRWATIGPDGCDGSLGPLTTPQPQSAYAAPPRRVAQPQPVAPGYYQEFQTPAGHAGTQLARTAPNQLAPRKARKAEPFLAGLLSLCFAGGGQLYNGQISKAIAFFVSFLILWAFALGWIVQIWAAVDAYQTAASQREPT